METAFLFVLFLEVVFFVFFVDVEESSDKERQERNREEIRNLNRLLCLLDNVRSETAHGGEYNDEFAIPVGKQQQLNNEDISPHPAVNEHGILVMCV